MPSTVALDKCWFLIRSTETRSSWSLLDTFHLTDKEYWLKYSLSIWALQLALAIQTEKKTTNKILENNLMFLSLQKKKNTLCVDESEMGYHGVEFN